MSSVWMPTKEWMSTWRSVARSRSAGWRPVLSSVEAPPTSRVLPMINDTCREPSRDNLPLGGYNPFIPFLRLAPPHLVLEMRGVGAPSRNFSSVFNLKHSQPRWQNDCFIILPPFCSSIWIHNFRYWENQPFQLPVGEQVTLLMTSSPKQNIFVCLVAKYTLITRPLSVCGSDNKFFFL